MLETSPLVPIEKWKSKSSFTGVAYFKEKTAQSWSLDVFAPYLFSFQSKL